MQICSPGQLRIHWIRCSFVFWLHTMRAFCQQLTNRPIHPWFLEFALCMLCWLAPKRWKSRRCGAQGGSSTVWSPSTKRKIPPFWSLWRERLRHPCIQEHLRMHGFYHRQNIFKNLPSTYFMLCSLVFAMSTGIDAMVVTRPDIIEATKWQKIPSWKVWFRKRMMVR